MFLFGVITTIFRNNLEAQFQLIDLFHLSLVGFLSQLLGVHKFITMIIIIYMYKYIYIYIWFLICPNNIW